MEEATEEAFYPIPLFLINLHGFFQFGNDSVPTLDCVLQENDFLSDIILLLLRKIPLPFGFLLQVCYTLLCFVKFGVAKDRI